MSHPSAPPGYNEAVTGEGKQSNYYQGQPGQPPYPAGGQPYGQPPYPAVGQPYPATETTTFQPGYEPAPEPTNAGNDTGFTTSGVFDDKNVRRVFIRKVYLTLAIQLLITFGIVTIFTLVKPIHTFLRQYSYVYYIAYAVFLVVYLTLVCCDSVRRKSPLNLVLLLIFTLAFSYMLGTIASFYSTQSVMIALGITVGVCIAVTLFSMQTKFDFTKCSGLLFVLVLVLMIFGIITIFTYRYLWYLNVVYGALGALVFTLFLAFNTQLIMGGKRYELSPEEYIYGALTLYIDVVYIFVFILQLVGGGR